MNDTLLSIIMPNRNGGRLLQGLFRSLQRQDIDLRQTEVLVMDADSEDNSLGIASWWNSWLDCRIKAISLPVMVPSLLRDSGMFHAQGEFLLLLDPREKLMPGALSTMLDRMDGRLHADLVYGGYVLTRENTSILQKPHPFRSEELARENTVGPTAMMRRAVWERCRPLKSNTAYFMWDFWIKAWQAGFSFAHLDKHILSRPLRQNRAREKAAQDGRAKAMVVVNNQGFFDARVVRWALAHLRGNPWAQAFEPGLIPDPRESGALLQGYIQDVMEARRKSFDLEAITRLDMLVA